MTKNVLKIGIMLAIGLGAFPVGIGLTEPPPRALPTNQASSASPSPSPTLADVHGDSLPPKALARLGSVRLRHIAGGVLQDRGTGLVVFSHDGKSLFSTMGTRNSFSLQQWDIATGKLIRQFDAGNQLNRRNRINGRIQLNNGNAPITLLAPSPDGTVLATSSQSGPLLLWDLATGKVRHQMNNNAIALVFSPDSKTLLATCRDGRIRVWEVASGKELQAQAIGGMDVNVQVIAVSPTGKTLVALGNNRINNRINRRNAPKMQLWDVATGKKVHELPELKDSPFTQTASSMAFSPDDRFLATASSCGFGWVGAAQRTDGAVRLWDVSTGKEARQIITDKAGTNCVAFSPDGKLLATGSGGGSIRLWEVATGKELRHCQGYRTHVVSLTFSADGTRLASGASGNDQTVRVWDVSTGKEITPPLGGHTAPILSVNFTPDGKSLVSGGRDGRVCLWDVETGRERRPFLSAGDYQSVTALSADGTTIASIGNSFTPNGQSVLQSAMSSPTIVRTWDAATGKEKRQFPGGNGCAQSVALSSDGKSLLSVNFMWGGGPMPALSASLWDVTTGKSLNTIQNIGGRGPSINMNAMFSPENKIYAVRSGDGSLSLFDVATGKRLDHCKGSENIADQSLGMVFSPNGQELATVGMLTQRGRRNQEQHAIHLWRLGSGKKLENCRALTGHEGVIYALAYSPDGRTIASAGDNGTIHVWETVSGKERCRFTGHQGQVWCLAFAPDGRRIASGSVDTTILIWDVTDRLDHGHLRSTPNSARSVEQLWVDLTSSDARQAGQAVWSLVAMPEVAVAFLKKQLVPVPVEKGRDQRIDQLIKQLDDDTFRIRKKAMSELMKLGVAAEPALRRVLESAAPAETKNRAKQLLADLQKKQETPPNEDCHRSRALEVLEQCGTTAARQLLESLSRGEPSAALTREAQASLARLSRRAAQQR